MFTLNRFVAETTSLSSCLWPVGCCFIFPTWLCRVCVRGAGIEKERKGRDEGR